MQEMTPKMRLDIARKMPMVMQNPTAQMVFRCLDSNDHDKMLELLQTVCTQRGVNYNELLQKLQQL